MVSSGDCLCLCLLVLLLTALICSHKTNTKPSHGHEKKNLFFQMAFSSISCFWSLLLLLLLNSSSLICFSLSTVSISYISDQTLVCALTNSSYLQCSSFPYGSVQFSLPDNLKNRRFSGVVSGNGFICGLISPLDSNTSTLLCWRGTSLSQKRIYQGPELDELEAGNSRICGIERVSRRLRCWQPFSLPQSGNYESIAVGENFFCGLSQPSGKIRCQGEDIANEPSRNSYISIVAGSRQACAITVDNDMECWGKTQPWPREKFSALAVGESRGCGVRWSDGTVLCWGSMDNSFSLPQKLSDIHFTSIYAKGQIFCGVATKNYTLYCWGNDNFESGVFEPFRGLVSQVVLPGPCREECPYGPLLGSELLCSNKMMICDLNRKDRKLPGTPTQQHSKKRTWSKKNIAFLVVGCFGTFCLILVISFLVYKSHSRCRIHDSGRLDDNRIIDTPKLEKRLSHLASIGNTGQLVEFSIDELAQATDGFAARFQLGIGSFGSVYHAVLSDGRNVAIKRAELTKHTSLSRATMRNRREEDKDLAFVNELESMSRLSHKNLVRLLGFYDDAEERVLVYEYMENGSLADHLHNPRFDPLTWHTRLKIALDAARGIQYLHEFVVPPVIHRDIKSSNILLDAMWTAKVSDFGLSQMGPTEEDISHLSLHAAGTLGYIDPEYYKFQQLTIKSDVYSFGVVLLELLSGHKAIHKNNDGSPRNIVEFVVPYILQDEVHKILDQRIPPPTPKETNSAVQLGYLATECLMPCSRQRPSMTEVVKKLERALASTCLAAPTTEILSRSNTY